LPQLLYHQPDNPVLESPFDRAILELAQYQDISIVCPYISLPYLQRLLTVAKSWRLISDVLEWLASTPASDRNLVKGFLNRHQGLVHHYPAIHAKVVVSPLGAYTGSANLTRSGVLRKTEFGVRLHDTAQVQEIQGWFGALWEQTSPPAREGVWELVDRLNAMAKRGEDAGADGVELDSPARMVRASLVKVLGEHPVPAMEVFHSSASSPAGAGARNAPAPTTALPEKLLVVPPPVAPSPAQAQAALPAAARLLRNWEIEDEVEMFIERHAAQGFTFAELHKAVGRVGKPSARQTLAAVLGRCASHPRSLFLEDSRHRLVYREGRFVASNKAWLEQALTPLDILLSWLLTQLSFSEARPMPAAAPATSTMPTARFRLLAEELRASHFVALNESGLAQLQERTPWSPRMKLLTRANAVWDSALGQHRLRKTSASLTSTTAKSWAAPAQSDPAEWVLPSLESNTAQDAALVEQAAKVRVAREEERWGKLDTLFARLATRYAESSGALAMSLADLTATLAEESTLQPSEVQRVLSGTYPYVKSPLLALPATSRRREVNLVLDLRGNEDLLKLPKTRSAISRSPVLSQSLADEKPLALKASKTVERPAARAWPADLAVASADLGALAQEADGFYLALAKHIFASNPRGTPVMATKSFMHFVEQAREAHGTYGSFNRMSYFIIGSAPPSVHLFRLVPSGTGISRLLVKYDGLRQFPKTREFLQTVVWNDRKPHSWLPLADGFQPKAPKIDPKLRTGDAALTPMALAMANAARRSCDGWYAEVLQLALEHGPLLPAGKVEGRVRGLVGAAQTMSAENRNTGLRPLLMVRPSSTPGTAPGAPPLSELVLLESGLGCLGHLPETSKLLARPDLALRRTPGLVRAK
jgi:hypothetical protein